MKKYLVFLVLFLMIFGTFVTPAHAQKKWTIMVFLNGDNNLDSAGDNDVQEMEKIGSSDQVDILVLQDHQSGGAERIYVKKNGKSEKTNVGETDMGDWHRALQFFKWGIDNHPAKHYFMAIWNHGAGWKLRLKDNEFKGVSYDDGSGHHITTPQLGELADGLYNYLGRKVDIFGFDACLMQMIEVSYEMKKAVHYTVGSEETEPGDGWPYDDFLGPLVANPDMSPKDLAILEAKKYNASYNGGSQGHETVTHSAVDVNAYTNFLPILDNFANALIENGSAISSIKSAISSSQDFYYHDYKDLYDFARLVKSNVNDSNIQNKADAVMTALKGSNNPVILYGGNTSGSMKNAEGLSIWIPDKSTYESKKTEYKALKFTKDSKWDEFIESIYYPKVPVLAIKSIDYKDANGDGKVSPGETIEFTVKVGNEGAKPGNNVTVKISSDDANSSVNGFGEANIASVPGMGEETSPAIAAKISDTCASNTTVSFTVKVIFNGKEVATQKEQIFVRKPFVVNNKVLLIVKKADDNFTKYYQNALKDAGISADVWDLSYDGKINSATLKKYVGGVVIYNAPDTSDITSVSTSDLASYLENGGSLFLSGQDIGYKLKNNDFYSNYMHAKFIQDNTGIHTVKFGDKVLKIEGGDGANNQKWPDEIDAIAPAKLIMKYDATAKNMKNFNYHNSGRTDVYRGINAKGGAGLFVDTGSYKVFYLGFGVEAISNSQDRAYVMKQAISMLMPKVSNRVASLVKLEKQLITTRNILKQNAMIAKIRNLNQIIVKLAYREILNGNLSSLNAIKVMPTNDSMIIKEALREKLMNTLHRGVNELSVYQRAINSLK
jgi:hypothetical protein